MGDEKYDDDAVSVSSDYTPSEFSSSSLLSPFRTYLRSLLLPVVRRESFYVAAFQRRFRSPFWDKYFVYSSALGTHTFFTILLPVLFFFGFDFEASGLSNREMGMGLVMIMGGGVYATSIVKDLVCSPRPLAPPVTRLTLGTHHLEYGFPSTHSTNSVSIALFFWGYANNILSSSNPMAYYLTTLLLIIYALSIVIGRIYTAMHSFIDCIFGVLMGVGVWWSVTDQFGGLALGKKLPEWVANATLSSSTGFNLFSSPLSSPLSPPLVMTSFFLFIINRHPQPIDDCPCFDDAIAMGAVVYGVLLGPWLRTYFHLDDFVVKRLGGPQPTLGSGWRILDVPSVDSRIWIPIERTYADISLFTFITLAKLVLGISLIFIWRLLAKSALGMILPPVFRAVARLVGEARDRLGVRWLGMPNRRFYLPATEYRGGVPNGLLMGGGSDDEDEDDEEGSGVERRRRRMRPIPSVIDLPSTLTVGVEKEGGIGSGSLGVNMNAWGGKSRLRRVNGEEVRDDDGDARGIDGEEQSLTETKISTKHYDADVLTKVIVYTGIAILATEITPVLFEILGWGVYVTPPVGALVQRQM